jgi:arylsulfatase A
MLLRPFALALCLALLPIPSAAAAPTAAAKPNLLFILADDYGIGEVGCYGADHYRTPNLDALARSGTRYTHAYTISLCGPSRAQILTGRYGFRTGGSNQDAVGEISPQRETLIPTVLKPAGYVSTMIGKWSQFSRQPSDFGFDEYLRYAGSGAYWNTQEKVRTYVVNGETRPLRDREYLPDLMHRHLVDFMTRHRDRPFYVHYSLSHVHGDILPTPDSAPDSQDHYADNVRYMDKLVGQLLAELDRLGLRERTLVVFCGDNGTGNGRAERATIGGRRLAGAKGSVLDGGGRVPLLVSWPGVVPAGRISADLVDSSDFLPTFAALAGAPLPANLVLDGRNQAAQFRGEAPGPRTWVFHQLARNWYVREAGWKLNQAGELFDMSDAPFVEQLVPAGSETPAALAARRRLAAALAELNPAGGIPDTGDESGRHAKNVEAKKKKGRDK